jgi:hypothetical protein
MVTRLSDGDNVRRDLRLALDQKAQADRLVEALTTRCDSLRSKLVAERQEAQRTIDELNEALAKERLERVKVEKRSSEMENRLQVAERELAQERQRSAELLKLAEAAIHEAVETTRAFT